MSPTDSRISHVSDTALMTAACRALETDRPNGWVRDPLAHRLAGERGMAIARSLKGLEMMCFGIGMRSRFLDDMIAGAIADHRITAVLNVGAGLDTRPWRLDLPANLTWVEADLPAMLEYKAAILDSEKPNCRVERIATDLNDPAQRSALFSKATGHALMITEGLLMYLPAATVEALGREAMAAGPLRHWLLDLSSGALARAVRTHSFQDIEAVRAPGNLDGEQIMEVLNGLGWFSAERRTYAADTAEFAPPGRLEAMARLAAAANPEQMPTPPSPNDVSGVHLFSHT